MDESAAESEFSGLLALPYELIYHTLQYLPTAQLFEASLSCKILHCVAADVLYRRMQALTQNLDLIMVLEIYPPINKQTTPSVFCANLGTPGVRGSLPLSDSSSKAQHDMTSLGKLYSHFRPIPRTQQDRMERIAKLNEFLESKLKPAEIEPMTQLCSLDVGERFFQLCVATHLVIPGPNLGVYRRFWSISDDVVRLQRKWLDTESKTGPNRSNNELESSTVWTDSDQNVAVKVNVSERRNLRAAPILYESEEELNKLYELHFEELRVRLVHILQRLETDVPTESGALSALVITNPMWRGAGALRPPPSP